MASFDNGRPHGAIEKEDPLLQFNNGDPVAQLKTKSLFCNLIMDVHMAQLKKEDPLVQFDKGRPHGAIEKKKILLSNLIMDVHMAQLKKKILLCNLIMDVHMAQLKKEDPLEQFDNGHPPGAIEKKILLCHLRK